MTTVLTSGIGFSGILTILKAFTLLKLGLYSILVIEREYFPAVNVIHRISDL